MPLKPKIDASSTRVEVSMVEDGQQRLTSIYLLLRAIRPVLEAKGFDKKTLNEVDDLLYFDSGTSEKEFRISNNFPKLEEDFQEVVGDMFQSLPKFPAGKRIKDNLAFFYAELHGLNKRDLERFFKRLIKDVYLSLVELDANFDVELTFEGMNSRGLSLSEMDKIKNYAILIISKNRDAIRYDRDKFVKIWFDTVRILDEHGLSGNSAENSFISDCFSTWSRGTPVGASKAHDWFKSKFAVLVDSAERDLERDFNSLLRHWNNFIDPYAKVLGEHKHRECSGKFTPECLTSINRIRRTRRHNVGHQLLVAAHAKFPKKDVGLIARFIELYVFRLLMNPSYRVRVDKNKPEFFRTAHDVFHGESTTKDVLQQLWQCVSNEDFKLSKQMDALFLSENMYSGKALGWPDSMYFLYEYDCFLSASGCDIPYERLRDSNQEHIIPQSVLENYSEEWKACFNKRGEPYSWVARRMHSLPNLALITSDLNSALQDRSFHHKAKGGNQSYDDDTHTLQQVSEIFSRHRHFDDKSLEKRERWMKAYTAARWTFPVKEDIARTKRFLKGLGMEDRLKKKIDKKISILERDQRKIKI